jgi:hypothetical protein
MLALKAQSRLTGVIIESVILALLSLCGTILLRLQWADPQCGTMWFDAKDILSVASNYHRGAEHSGWQALTSRGVTVRILPQTTRFPPSRFAMCTS